MKKLIFLFLLTSGLFFCASAVEAQQLKISNLKMYYQSDGENLLPLPLADVNGTLCNTSSEPECRNAGFIYPYLSATSSGSDPFVLKFDITNISTSTDIQDASFGSIREIIVSGALYAPFNIIDAGGSFSLGPGKTINKWTITLQIPEDKICEGKVNGIKTIYFFNPSASCAECQLYYKLADAENLCAFDEKIKVTDFVYFDSNGSTSLQVYLDKYNFNIASMGTETVQFVTKYALPADIVRDLKRPKKFGVRFTIQNTSTSSMDFSGFYNILRIDSILPYTNLNVDYDSDAYEKRIDNFLNKPAPTRLIEQWLATTTKWLATTTPIEQCTSSTSNCRYIECYKYPQGQWTSEQAGLPLTLKAGEATTVELGLDDCWQNQYEFIGLTGSVKLYVYRLTADGPKQITLSDGIQSQRWLGERNFQLIDYHWDRPGIISYMRTDKPYYAPTEEVKILTMAVNEKPAPPHGNWCGDWCFFERPYSDDLPTSSWFRVWVYNDASKPTNLTNFLKALSTSTCSSAEENGLLACKEFKLTQAVDRSYFGTYRSCEQICDYLAGISANFYRDITKCKDACSTANKGGYTGYILKNFYLGDISFNMPEEENPPDNLYICIQAYNPKKNRIPLRFTPYCETRSLTPLINVTIPQNTNGNCQQPQIIKKDGQTYYQVQCSNLKYNNKTPTINKQYMTRFTFASTVEDVLSQYNTSNLLSSSTNQLSAKVLLLKDNTTSSETKLFYQVSLDPQANATPTVASSIEFLSKPQPNQNVNATYTHQFACDLDNDGYLAPYCCDSSLLGYDQVREICQKGFDCNDADARIHPGADWKNYVNCDKPNDPGLNIMWDCQSYPNCAAYQVEINNLNFDWAMGCIQSRIPRFNWSIKTLRGGEKISPENYNYQIDIYSGSSCEGNPLVTERFEGQTTTHWIASCQKCCDVNEYNQISFGGTTYCASVRAQAQVKENSELKWTDWASTTNSFTTQPACWPIVDFTCNGEDCARAKITAGMPVTLNNTSTYKRESTCLWTFDPAVDYVTEIIKLADGSTTTKTYTAYDCTTKVKFQETPKDKKQKITLTVTDSEYSNITCSATKEINVEFLALPKYKEVPPLKSVSNLLQKNFAALIAPFRNLFR
ncbi:MAG: hypothetical protein ACPLW9_02540 [Minisyncoccales bacterium]